MKKIGRRCGALALALALTAGLTQSGRASWALGSELVERTVELGQGTTLTSQSLWSASKSDLRTEHYITYTPNPAVKPMVFSGTYVASTNTVQTAAAQLEEEGYRVAAAINGGFFNTDGTVVGMLMTDGALRSLDVDNYTLLGFTQDGRVFIDESKPKASVAWTGLETVAPPEDQSWLPPTTALVEREFPLAGFNAYRNSNFLGGLYLYNQDFSSKVLSGGTSVSAILRPLAEGGLRLNGLLAFRVESVTDTAQEGVEFDGVIPEGCYMLYAEDRGNPELLDALRALTPGTQLTVAVDGVSDQWVQAAYGLSGRYTLLREGQIVEDLPTTDNPYTAVGVKEDGTAVFYTIDGRQSGWSIGATYAQVAQRLQELGCVTAVALDGGGSTTLGATLPGSEHFSVVNRPSTSGRRLNNTILLAVRAEEAVLAPGAYVTAERQVVLAGAELAVSAVPYDGTGRPLEGQLPVWTTTGGTVVPAPDAEPEPLPDSSASDAPGTIPAAPDGAPGDAASGTQTAAEPVPVERAVYTAGMEPGTYAISASWGGGAMPVRVVNELSVLTVSREDNGLRATALALKPGEEVDLTAAGTWWNLPVAMADKDVVWTADPEVGVIDETGHFTAKGDNGEGTITAAAGGQTVTISVKVDRGDPFTDVAGHWSVDYVTQLYQLGLTTGYGQEDGTAVYLPDGQLTRAELLAFITRLLGVDESAYYTVELPFADNETIPNWAQNYVQAMYTLGVLRGSEEGGLLYANVNSYITREETMTILGRVLAVSQECDLSAFPDAGLVSDWALPHVQTLVGLSIVGGMDGLLAPGEFIDRAAIAKLLVEVYPLEKALLLPRLDLMS